MLPCTSLLRRQGPSPSPTLARPQAAPLPSNLSAVHGRRPEFGAEEDGARRRRCESSTEEDGARPPWTPTIELLPWSISHPRLSSARSGRGRGRSAVEIHPLSMDAAVELSLGRASLAMDAAVELPFGQSRTIFQFHSFASKQESDLSYLL